MFAFRAVHPCLPNPATRYPASVFFFWACVVAHIFLTPYSKPFWLFLSDYTLLLSNCCFLLYVYILTPTMPFLNLWPCLVLFLLINPYPLTDANFCTRTLPLVAAFINYLCTVFCFNLQTQAITRKPFRLCFSIYLVNVLQRLLSNAFFFDPWFRRIFWLRLHFAFLWHFQFWASV